MECILNTHTKTIHKPRDAKRTETTACGSLRHVPPERTRVVSGDEAETDDALERCGSCFEGAGGY